MSQRGFARPGFAAKDGTVLGGNLSVVEVASSLGMDEVVIVETDGTRPIVHVRTDLEPDSDAARMLAIEDNRTAEVSLDWDADELLAAANELDLSKLFTKDELAEATAGAGQGPTEAPDAPIDKADELQEKWQVKPGDLWCIGEHRLICGDCTDKVIVERLMQGERAQILINDPPYGMRLGADFSNMVSALRMLDGKGIKGGKKYPGVIGDQQNYDAAPVASMFGDVPEQFWFGADYYASTLDDTQHNGAWLVWDKRLDESADKMYGSCFELIWSSQRHKRDILRHKWAGVFGSEKEPQKGRTHPNQKPVELYVDILMRYSKDGCIVVDCYNGSGTTLVACEQLHRKGRGVEIEPKYCAVTLERLSLMGLTPELLP